MPWFDPNSPVMSTLGLPFKAIGAPWGAVKSALAGQDWTQAFADPDTAASGADVLRHYGAGDGLGTTLGGLAIDLADPVSWAAMGGLGKGFQALRGAGKLAEGAETLGNVGRAGEIAANAEKALPAATRAPVGEDQIMRWINPQPPAPPFFSRISEAAQTLPERIKAPSLQNMLKKAPGGVSDEEMQYALRNVPKAGMLDRNAVTEAIGRDGLRVEEKMYGPQSKAAAASLSHGDVTGFTDEEMQHALQAETSGVAPKYSDFKTPGGENYRELLLKMPITESDDLAKGVARMSPHELDAGIQTHMGDRIPEAFNGRTWDALTETERASLRREARTALAPQTYTSPHWPDDPNVIAHIRFDDRIGPDGEKALHVHEIQSDWHQAGKKNGYGTPSEAKTAALKEAATKAYDAMKAAHDKYAPQWDSQLGMYSGPNAEAITNEVDSLMREARIASQNIIPSVPDAPFKDNEWAKLALKRMIRYAADNDYDRISFNNGELAKHFAAGGGGELKGLNAWYNKTLPDMMKKLTGQDVEHLKVQIPTSEIKWHLGLDGGVASEQVIPSFRIPDDLKNKVRERGWPLLSLAPWLAGTGFAGYAANQQE